MSSSGFSAPAEAGLRSLPFALALGAAQDVGSAPFSSLSFFLLCFHLVQDLQDHDGFEGEILHFSEEGTVLFKVSLSSLLSFSKVSPFFLTFFSFLSILKPFYHLF